MAKETYARFLMGDDDTVKWEIDGLRWCLHVQRDRTPLNPRKDFDNLATMICFGNRGLGDDHRFKNPEDFWQRLVRENVDYKEIWEAAVTGKIAGIRIAESQDDPGYYDVYETSEFRTILGNCQEDEWREYSGLTSMNVPYYILDDLTVSNCMELLKPYIAWLPLWVYEHSGITMSAGPGNPFTCKWDSGQVGWIIMTKKKAMEDLSEYVLDDKGERIRIDHKHPDGRVTFCYKTRKLTDETWREIAEDHMRCEVATYDQYLTDDVYGYTLYSTDEAGENPEWDEEDSCWGFFGDDIMENGICDNVGADLYDAIISGQHERGTASYETISYLRL